MVRDMHPAMIDLFHLAESRGWLGYDELNNTPRIRSSTPTGWMRS
ncbi:MAG: hypothetical protein AAGI30_10520 [Planctomycetota bacterium]